MHKTRDNYMLLLHLYGITIFMIENTKENLFNVCDLQSEQTVSTFKCMGRLYDETSHILTMTFR